jgi:hypothetical protein
MTVLILPIIFPTMDPTPEGPEKLQPRAYLKNYAQAQRRWKTTSDI